MIITNRTGCIERAEHTQSWGRATAVPKGPAGGSAAPAKPLAAPSRCPVPPSGCSRRCQLYTCALHRADDALVTPPQDPTERNAGRYDRQMAA